MPRLRPEHISDFIRAVMPSTATGDDLRLAQIQLDDYLDAIDALHTRLESERRAVIHSDKALSNDILERPPPL